MAHTHSTGRVQGQGMTSEARCVDCGYRPCSCPFYAEDDKYEVYYDHLLEISAHEED